MNNEFHVKIATGDDVKNYYDKLIEASPEDIYLPSQKNKRLQSLKSKTRMFFYGYLDGEVITQGSATVSVRDEFTQNKEQVVSEKCAYLFNFLTVEEERGKGYFSKLYRFIEKTLSDMGFEYLSLGVEPEDTENRERYRKMGFDELIYCGCEEFDGMKIDVEYYRKKI